MKGSADAATLVERRKGHRRSSLSKAITGTKAEKIIVTRRDDADDRAWQRVGGRVWSLPSTERLECRNATMRHDGKI